MQRKLILQIVKRTQHVDNKSKLIQHHLFCMPDLKIVLKSHCMFFMFCFVFWYRNYSLCGEVLAL